MFGSIATVIALVAISVFGIGAWAALGASGVALVIGAFARSAPQIAKPPAPAEYRWCG